jgi:hypothetical protein
MKHGSTGCDHSTDTVFYPPLRSPFTNLATVSPISIDGKQTARQLCLTPIDGLLLRKHKGLLEIENSKKK